MFLSLHIARDSNYRSLENTFGQNTPGVLVYAPFYRAGFGVHPFLHSGDREGEFSHVTVKTGPCVVPNLVQDVGETVEGTSTDSIFSSGGNPSKHQTSPVDR